MRGFEFWDRKSDGLLPSLLRPIGCVVAGLAAIRQKSTKPWKAPVPVICVGNIVVGGAGKTPVALDLIDRLQARGQNVHVVSRGYGGTLVGPARVELETHSAREVGDEPLLLAQKAPTWVSRERRLGIEAAVAQGAEVIIMDDGYQNPSVAKDLSLVVTDGGYGFGNGLVMPAGPLREPIDTGLKRADAVILVGADEADVWGRVKRHGNPSLSVIRAQIKPVGDFENLRGKKIFAFAGIGRPEKFYATLKSMGCNVVATRSFDDHHPYREAEIVSILSDAVDMVVVTTAKDYVRLRPEHQKRIKTVNIELSWKDDREINSLLDEMLNKTDTTEDNG